MPVKHGRARAGPIYMPTVQATVEKRGRVVGCVDPSGVEERTQPAFHSRDGDRQAFSFFSSLPSFSSSPKGQDNDDDANVQNLRGWAVPNKTFPAK